MDDDQTILEALELRASQATDALPDLAVAVVAFLVFLVVGVLIGRAVRAGLQRRGERVYAAFVGRLPAWVFAFGGILVATDIMGLEGVATGLAAGGGATAIILGFAFREIGENFLAGLFLAFSRPFRLGDLIQSGSLPEGTVRAVALRSTHVRTADGRDLYIPNATIFNEPLVNFTQDGLRRPTFSVGVDYRCPMTDVLAAITRAVHEVPGVLSEPEPYATIIAFEDTHVRLEVAVWIDTFSGTVFNITQSLAMDAARSAIVENGWATSADVSTAIEVSGRLEGPNGADDGATSPPTAVR